MKDNSQQEQSEQQPEKDSGEKRHFSLHEIIYNCIYNRTVYILLYLKQRRVAFIIMVSLFYLYPFVGCSPSVSQAESQEEVKEKKPDDVCWQ